MRVLPPGLSAEFLEAYGGAIEEALVRRRLEREPWWTESIAVGDKEFVRQVSDQTLYRRRLETIESTPGIWMVREASPSYDMGRTAE